MGNPIGWGRLWTATGLTLMLWSPALAQPEASYVANLSSANGYHWRGIWRSRAPVIQADVGGALRLGQVSLAAGAWANLEPRTAPQRHLTDLPAGSCCLSEWDLWGQGMIRQGILTAIGGIMQSRYRREGPDPRVTEVYGIVRLQGRRLALSGEAWVPIEGADGAYFEPSVTVYHFVNPLTGPALALTSTLSAGVQTGLHRGPLRDPSIPGPEGTGLVHMTLSTQIDATLWLTGRVALFSHLAVAHQWRVDEATKIRGDGTRGAGYRIWFPIRIGVSLGQEPRS